MKSGYQKKPQAQRHMAEDSIRDLFEQAAIAFRRHPDLSDRYMRLARKIAMKYKVRIPLHLKRQVCRNCGGFLVPGSNCRIRLSGGKVVYYCGRCRTHMRYPLHGKRLPSKR